jgi:cell division protein FtsL
MLFQEATPNTVFYMILGYAVFFIVSAIYLLSMYIRHRSLRRDLETLEELDRPK